MNQNKYGQRLKEIQMAFDRLKQIENEEAHKLKNENGLLINIKILNDARNIECFNLNYQKDLILFNLENIGKTEQDFIENKIEEIKLKEIENIRKWNLSDNDFCRELKLDKRFENKFKDSHLTDEEIIETHFFKDHRNSFKPSEFEDYRLTFYKQKLNCIPNKTVEKPLLKKTNQYTEIFSNNGFELFNYILENHIKQKEKRGRYADISYFYWRMYNDKEKYIHQRPEVFKKWFCDKFSDSFEKIKTINEVNDINGNRKKHYQTSLDWFKKEFNITQ